MSSQSFRTPKIRDIALGIIAFLILLGLIRTISVWVKAVGMPFLYIPSRLGLVQMVSPGDVQIYPLTTNPKQFDFARAGRYAVFTNDLDLLMITDLMIASDSPPWLTVTSQASGVAMPVAFVKRGLLPYDTPYAQGRPILTIEISRPGTYLLTHPGKGTLISFVPDYTTGKEGVIVAAYVIQLAVILGVLGAILYPRYQRRRTAQKTAQLQKRKESDRFWRNELQRKARARKDGR